MITERLYLFLKNWQSGDVHDHTSIGLCTNALMQNDGHLTKRDLSAALYADFNDTCNPFGNDYAERSHVNTMHLCPKRLAWVDSKVKEYERNLAD